MMDQSKSDAFPLSSKGFLRLPSCMAGETPLARRRSADILSPAKRHARLPGRQSGMTLVEVLLAIVILGSALAALLGAASQAIGVVKQARNYETARTMLAQVEVEKPLRLEEEITVGEESGSFKDGPAGWRWSRKIEAASEEGEDDEKMGGLYLVTTTVYWGSSSGKTSSEETVRYLYVPENIDGKRTLRPKGL